MPTLVMGALTASYVVSGNGVRAGAALIVTMAAAAVTAVQQRRGRGFASREITAWLPIAVPALLSRLAEDPASWRPSAILAAFASTMAVVAAAGIDPRRPIVAGATAVVTAVRVVLATLIGVIVLMPLGIARLWRRNDPLGTGRGDRTESAWHDVGLIRPTPTRSFRVERPAQTSAGRAALRMAPQAIGIIVLVLAVDLAVGWAWQEATGADAPTSTTVRDPVGVAKGGSGVHPDDPREQLPALAAYPWAHDWFQEANSVSRYYWPYLLWRNAPFQGRYLNIEGLTRVSYRSPGVTAADAPEVAFLGGSTTYGIAQRDEHTIASEVARLAEADGIPIRAMNYGVSGYVNWQEMLLFEQLAADPDTRPDLAVFYDGANEVPAQTFGIVGVPSHTALTDVQEALDSPSIIRNPDAPPAAVLAVTLRDLRRIYQAHSASSQIFGWLRDQVDRPAGAAPSQAVPPTAEEAEASIDVYRRGRDLILELSRRYDVDTLLFWQPRAMYESERQAMDRLDAPTIDISDALDDHQDVYIDGNHHNEEGARIVAAAIWEHLRPQVERWYEAHR